MSRLAYIGASLLLLLLGCGRIGYDCEHCEEPAFPSNGVTLSDTMEATAALEVTGVMRVDTNTGQIDEEGALIRPAGEGIANGILFAKRPNNIAVFGVASMSIQASGVLRAYGNSTFILVAAGDVRSTGIIDVSAGLCADGSALNQCPGPGGGGGAMADQPALGCAPGGDGVQDGDTGGGGGGLGSHGAAGGRETDENLAPGGAAGFVLTPPCPRVDLIPLTGGSGGGLGGGSGGGSGGGGGGAVQITSFASILLAGGGILAAGNGGEGGDSESGGGGGGSGGAIMLEAMNIDLGASTLAANGGGGGEGKGTAPGAPGGFGDAAAPGGVSDGIGGGNGGSARAAPTSGQRAGNDTGGGGGGVGIISIHAVTSAAIDGALISPQPAFRTSR